MPGLIVKNVTYLDPESGEFRPDTSVRVQDDRFVEVNDGLLTTSADDVEVIDGGGRTMLPGLIDAHVHPIVTSMDVTAMINRSQTRIGIEAKTVLERMLRRGFTTVRDAGGLDRGLAEALELGFINGPRTFRSGRVISQTGGHGDLTTSTDTPHLCGCGIESDFFSRVADGPEAIRRAVREDLKDGVDQIKMMAGGGVASPTDAIDTIQYTEDEIRVGVVEASNRNTYVMAHAYVPQAITQAVKAGVRSIEHGCLLDDASARVMAQHGTYLVPTMVVYQQLKKFGHIHNFPSKSMEKLEFVLHASNGAVETALAAGVKLGFGTDLLGETHDAQSDEFALRSVVQPAIDVIRSATLINAEILGRSDDLGAIKPGAFADLLLIDGNPLEDLSVLGGQGDHLDLIMRAGKVIKNRID
ncbi:MAG: amidohydrolase family protein [Actinomycetia bacterium]|nr:amidohydrolase family protein [Actinomycetes bacterium]